MINIFKKAKTVKEQIEEIHETFYTEVDRLLSAANITHSGGALKQPLIEKGERLKKLGFTTTAEVSKSQKDKEELETAQDLIEAIKYFSFKYPQYKFITEKSVKTICEKYNLVYGEVGRYIGTVPDINLNHIENFKILEEDKAYISSSIWSGDRFIHHKDVNKAAFYSSNGTFTKAPLEIAAPLKDFNLTKAELKDFKISNIHIPDPIVLQPVMFKNTKHYLIVTAWGDEASDDLIMNQNHN